MRTKRATLETHPKSSLGLPLSDDQLTLGHALRWSAQRYTERRALTFEERSWTYKEMWDEVQRYAAALVDAGVGKGTRVALMMGTRPEFVFLLYANALVGGVSVLISTFSTAAEARWILGHSDASLLIAHTAIRDRAVREELVDEMPALGAPQDQLRDVTFPYLQRVVWLPTPAVGDSELQGGWNDFLAKPIGTASELVEARCAAVVPDDDALLLYTSG